MALVDALVGPSQRRIDLTKGAVALLPKSGSPTTQGRAGPAKTSHSRNVDSGILAGPPVADHPADAAAWRKVFLAQIGFPNHSDIKKDADFKKLAAKHSMKVDDAVYRFDTWLDDRATPDPLAHVFTDFCLAKTETHAPADPETELEYLTAVHQWLLTAGYSADAPTEERREVSFLVDDKNQSKRRNLIIGIIHSRQDGDKSGGRYYRLPDRKGVPTYLIQLQAQRIAAAQFDHVIGHEILETLERRLGNAENVADMLARFKVLGRDSVISQMYIEDPSPYSPGMQHARNFRVNDFVAPKPKSSHHLIPVRPGKTLSDLEPVADQILGVASIPVEILTSRSVLKTFEPIIKAAVKKAPDVPQSDRPHLLRKNLKDALDGPIQTSLRKFQTRPHVAEVIKDKALVAQVFERALEAILAGAINVALRIRRGSAGFAAALMKSSSDLLKKELAEIGGELESRNRQAA